MKKLAVLLVSVLLFSCSEPKDEYALVGNWKLTETLIDPGDGSGVFEKTTFDWTLEFLPNGTIQSSKSLCLNGSSNDATYTDTEIKGTACDAPVYTYKQDGKYLILTHGFCIEPCRYKFLRDGAADI